MSKIDRNSLDHSQIWNMSLVTITTCKEPSNKMKTSEQNSDPSVVKTTCPWDIEPTLETLCKDAQLHIVSFLDESSLRHFASINAFFRSFILSIPESKQVIWMPRLSRRWNVPMNAIIFGRLKDYMGLPTAATTFAMMERTRPFEAIPRRNHVNLPLLLSMTCPQIASQVDRSFLDPTDASSKSVRATEDTTETSTHWEWMEDDTIDNNDDDHHHQQKDKSIITYTGPIGVGNRCVRSNHPLPRPIPTTFGNRVPKGSILKRHRSYSTQGPGGRSAEWGGLLTALRQGVGTLRRNRKAEFNRPFCSPYFEKDGTLNVTPTMVAYYEVEILRQKKEAGKEDDDGNDKEHPDASPRLPCVAIGLGTKAFRLQSRMPGWDFHSVGYHGDDGRIFFGGGSPSSSPFGPAFGTGDTIGCGIDYVNRGIFFTLNGRFLGYAWKNVRSEMLDRDWYPVVGIDTNAPIRLNFGRSPHHPFQYNLEAFHAIHRQRIQPLYQFSTSLASGRRNHIRRCRFNISPPSPEIDCGLQKR